MMKLLTVVHSAGEGGYWAEVPALPGCASQGETLAGLRSNLREAVEGVLLAGSTPQDAAEVSVVLEPVP